MNTETLDDIKNRAAELDTLSVLTRKELVFAKKHGMTYVGTAMIQDWVVLDWPIRVSLLKMPGVENEYVCKTAFKDHNTGQYHSKFRNVGWISRGYGDAKKYHWSDVDVDRLWDFKRYVTHNWWSNLEDVVSSEFWRERVPTIRIGNLKFNSIIKSTYEYGKPGYPFGKEHQFLFASSINYSLPYAEYTFSYLLVLDSTEEYKSRDWRWGNCTSRHLGVNIDYERIENVINERFFGTSRTNKKFNRDLMFVGAKDKQVFVGLSTDVSLESLTRVFKGLKFKVEYYDRPKKD